MGISAEQERTKIASFVSYSWEPRRVNEGMVHFGSRWATRRVGLILGLMIPDLAWVHIGFTFGGLSNEESLLREARQVFGCWSVLRF